MGKVKIKNVMPDMCVGFSFKSLRPNQTTVVDEEIVTEADKRLITKGMATLEEWDGVIDKAPVAAPVEEVVDAPEVEEEEVSSQDIITPGSEDSTEVDDNIVIPSDIAAEEIQDDDNADADDSDESADAGEFQVEDKAYTREELTSLGRKELRAIGKPLGVKGRGVEKLIEDILKAQGTNTPSE